MDAAETGTFTKNAGTTFGTVDTKTGLVATGFIAVSGNCCCVCLDGQQTHH